MMELLNLGNPLIEGQKMQGHIEKMTKGQKMIYKF
jgi:ribosomal protein L21